MPDSASACLRCYLASRAAWLPVEQEDICHSFLVSREHEA